MATPVTRAQLVAAITARLARASGIVADQRAVLEHAAAAEAAELAGITRDNDLQAAYVLAVLHWMRYQLLPEGEDDADAEAAVRWLRRVLPMAPEPIRDALQPVLATLTGTPGEVPHLLNDKALRLISTPRAMADREQLDRAVELLRRAVHATRVDDPERAGFLSNLSSALQARFTRTGSGTDLDAAVEAERAAVAAIPGDHPERVSALNNLSAALGARFERTGSGTDLDEALEAGRAAVAATPVGHANRAIRLSNLAGTLLARFERTGSGTDLDEAVDATRAAVAATPPDHPHRVVFLANLGGALRTRCERTGSRADLDAAVEAGRAAVAGTFPGHPEHPRYLIGLAVTLLLRFWHAGSGADLDEAVEAGRAAVVRTPIDHPHRVIYLANLAGVLEVRFRRTESGADLDEAVEAGRAAAAGTPVDDYRRARYLNNLGNALRTRFSQTGSGADLDEAVEAGRAAVAAIPDDHADRARMLSNLGLTLWFRHWHTGIGADLDEAVDVSRRAVLVAPADHPARATYLSNLGDVLCTRFAHTGDAAVRAEALQAFRSGAQLPTAWPLFRARCGRWWARLAGDSGDWPQADRAWSQALTHLPTLVDRSLSRTDRQHHLGLLQDLGPGAASAAVAVGDLDRAWVALEQGRGVLLGQALETRADTRDLGRRHPELADEVDRLRLLLNADIPAVDPAAIRFPGPAVDEPARRRMIVREWEQLTARIRGMPGFDRFGLPPTLAELCQAAAGGTVVAIVIATDRCYALILTRYGSDVVELPDLVSADAMRQAALFLEATHEAENNAGVNVLRGVLGWLWDVVAGPVLDYLGYTGTPDGVWPRVWWIPTGTLSVLPLHAAGHHESGMAGGRRTVLDRVVSSYTPTVRGLHHSRRQRTRDSTDALVVGVSNGAGLGPLTSAVPEARLVHAILRARRPPLLDTDATRHAILQGLPESGWVHLACHATTAFDPGDSHLALSDGPLPVRELTSLEVTDGYLAYLSACSTAYGGTRLPDESIHIASALQLAGFAHVIGTLWPISDAVAPQVSTHIYRQVTAGIEPALAVHHAVHALRAEYPGHPRLWASHIHLGP